MTIREAVYCAIYSIPGFDRAHGAPQEVQDEHRLFRDLGLEELDMLEIVEDVEEAVGVDIFDLDLVIDRGSDLTVGGLIKALEDQQISEEKH